MPIVVMNRHQIPFMVELVASMEGCSGCVANTNPELQLRCSSLPNCSGGVFKLVPSASAGSYHEAWIKTLQARQEVEVEQMRTGKCIIINDWKDPLSKFEGLTGYLSASTYPVPTLLREAFREFGAPADWHKLALELPREIDGKVYYARNRKMSDAVAAALSDWAEAYKSVYTTPGRYLTRHWPSVPADKIRNLVAELTARDTIKIVKTMDEILHAVQAGPTSCMQWSETGDADYRWWVGDDEDNGTTGVHPYMAYEPKYGWGMAIRKEYNQIVARALVYEEGSHKCFVRSYGKESNGNTGSDAALDAWLIKNGYEYRREWPEGSRLKNNRDEEGEPCVPYTDPGPNRRPDNGNRFVLVVNCPDGDFYSRHDDGHYVFDNTNGSVDTAYSGTSRMDYKDWLKWMGGSRQVEVEEVETETESESVTLGTDTRLRAFTFTSPSLTATREMTSPERLALNLTDQRTAVDLAATVERIQDATERLRAAYSPSLTTHPGLRYRHEHEHGVNPSEVDFASIRPIESTEVMGWTPYEVGPGPTIQNEPDGNTPWSGTTAQWAERINPARSE